ncbi:Hpt domain-containing protein [Mariprofundus erugo]|nr:Hpt domain-containing protein [Mariprofundus erugo]
MAAFRLIRDELFCAHRRLLWLMNVGIAINQCFPRVVDRFRRIMMHDTGSELDLVILDGLLGMIRMPEKRWNLLTSFETGAQEHLQRLELMAGEGGQTAFLSRVHTIKGGSGALGMKQIVALCLEIEAAGASLDAAAMSAYVVRLRSAFNAGAAALSAHLEQLHPRT